MRKLLFEIGTEEMPANFMPGILAELKELAEKKMKEARIPFTSVAVYGTPRRMAFIADGVEETQADTTEEFKGPSAKIAFDAEGNATKAAMGFARGKGVDVKDLIVRDDYIYAVKHTEGEATAAMLPALLQDILASMNFPKNMRWADFDVKFVRPIRWLVALFGADVVPVSVTDVVSDRYSRGHRFLSTGKVEIPEAGAYVDTLKDSFVLVDQDKRRELIRQQIIDVAHKQNGEAQITEDLLEEVNYLVEWPTALCGKFEEKYLALPEAAIITPMHDHQRYFPVRDKEGKLLNEFITVRNGGEKFLENVAHGNERVLRARLSDAEFFFNEDRREKLEDRQEKIKTVVFQEGLGNMYDKSQRLMQAVETIHFALNSKTDLADLKRTAMLCKCDLVTGMVTEFTELQGVMGREYGLLDGEKSAICQGIYEHYLPRFAGDELPASEIGRILSIADKIDNIVATFSRGLIPTGSQDPYALRRQALGIINILLDSKYHLGLIKIMGAAVYLLQVPQDEARNLISKVLDFIKQRFRNLMLDRGIRYDVVDAVLADVRNDDIYDLYLRAIALNEFVAGEDAPEIIQAATRVNNLSSKQETEEPISPTLFQEEAEKELYAVINELDKELIPLMVRYDYKDALVLPKRLTAAVNKFFEDVMVMDKDERIKTNRLALLCAARDIMNAVGDMSKIVM